MISWVFIGISLAAACNAALASDARRAILALWVTGLSIGAFYLTVGSELLAVVQWIVSTLGAISFVFFGVMFGEFEMSESHFKGKAAFQTSLALLVGASFVGMVWLGGHQFISSIDGASAAGEANDLMAVGRVLSGDHLISLEVLALTLFLILIGGGVIARPESGKGDQ